LHGLPSVIVSDRDPRWTGNFWRALFKALGTKLAFSTPYHPQTDGQTERLNRVLEEMARMYVNARQNDWDEFLPMFEFAYNDSWQSSTRATPFFLNYGGHPDGPLARAVQSEVTQVPAAQDLYFQIHTSLAQAMSHIKVAQERQRQYANKDRRDVQFQPGDQVMLSTAHFRWADGRSNKLRPKRVGPFPVTRVISSVAYELELPANFGMHPVVHVSSLTPYHESALFGSRMPAPPPPMLLPGGGEALEVERLLQKRVVGRGRGQRVEYLVRWKGMGQEHDTWQPANGLSFEDLAAYWDP